METTKKTPAYVKYFIITFLLIAISIGLFATSIVYFAPEYESTKATIRDTASLSRRIETIVTDREAIEKRIAESGKVYNNLYLTKDNFVALTGSLFKTNNLTIEKITVDDIKPDNASVSVLPISVEFTGDSFDVKNLLQSFNNLNVPCRIVSFSYRVIPNTNDALTWMERSYDSTSFVEWWDEAMKGKVEIEVKSDYDKNEEDELTEEEQRALLLSADKLLYQGPTVCYLEIEYLGTGG